MVVSLLVNEVLEEFFVMGDALLLIDDGDLPLSISMYESTFANADGEYIRCVLGCLFWVCF